MPQNLKKISLTNYRNFKEFDLNINSKITIISGNNGSGKTNILEAISLLTPGKGLRNAKIDEICKAGEIDFENLYDISGILGSSKIKVFSQKNATSKVIEFNEKKIPNHELAKLCSIIWLTPQMEWLFINASSDRRKFFDRIIYSFDPAHASRINKYEYYLKERIKILELKTNDTNWLDLIETKLSEISLEIIKKRHEIINVLQESLDNLKSPFPKARIAIEPNYKDKSLEWIKEQFKNARKEDSISLRNSFGPHKVDFVVFYDSKNIPAKFCSTGEQKAMLISITIAQIIALKAISKHNTILLLDEIFVHLDNQRMNYLSDFISSIESQSFITSTEEEISKLFIQSELIML